LAEKSKFAAILTGDHKRLAELAEEKGELAKASEMWERGGEFSRAITLAIKAGSDHRAIRCAFRAALGADAGVPANATTRQAGEVLKAAGKLPEALLLFEQASAYAAAGEVATKLKQPIRAARLFEKAGDWGRAAIYFESERRWADAVRMLGLRSRELQQLADSRRDGAAEQQRREVDDRRASLLAKLGRHDEAGKLVSGLEATPQSAAVLENAGRPKEAFEGYLQMGDHDAAYRSIPKIKDLTHTDRATLLQRCGHAKEAASELCKARLHPQAARVLEAESMWPEAARVWELAGDSLAAGTAYRRAGDHEAAGRCFKEGGKPELAADSFAHLGRHSDAVTYYLQAGKTVEAAEAYERNHQYREAAKYFLQAGHRDRAIAALGGVRPGSDDYNSASLKISSLLLEDGRAEEALTAARLVPDDPRQVGVAALDRLYWEGRCLEALGQGDAAHTRYKDLSAIDASHKDVAARLTSATSSELESGQPGVLGPGVELAGRYRIEAEIGRGGMGCVYRALDRELDETVAIKVVLHLGSEGSPEAARLIREVQICRRITHPNIVRMHDIGRFEEGLFISMELLEGEDLAALIERDPRLPLARCRDILSGVLSGLNAAHGQKVVHRDLKPSNIFLTSERPKILDFGIAQGQAFDARLTQTGQAMGTPLYMAPEQLRGLEVNERTDLYSLGLVAYEMICGSGPFSGNNPGAIALDHVQTPPPNLRDRRAELPESWAQFVHRLLAKDPASRLPSAAHALNVIHALPVG